MRSTNWACWHCGTRIGEKQTDEEPMTVASVKEMIEYAISKERTEERDRQKRDFQQKTGSEGLNILFRERF